MEFSDLSQDLVDKILVSLTDFKSLAATILTSKHVYDVFQTRPKSIVAAVACNVVGHADVLPAAVRMVRAYQDSNDPESDEDTDEDDDYDEEENEERPEDEQCGPPPPEDDVMRMSLTRTQAESLVDHAPILQELENFFSWMHKDRMSSASMLAEDESVSFRRAMYRLWLYRKLFKHPRYFFNLQQPDDEQYRKVIRPRLDFLTAFPLEELHDIWRAVSFTTELLQWATTVCRDVLLAPDSYRSAIRRIFPYLQGGRWQPQLFEAVYASILEKAEIGAEDRDAATAKAILRKVVGEHDACDRCHSVQGPKLFGANNWGLLHGHLSPSIFETLLHGRLRYNIWEMMRMYEILFAQENGTVSFRSPNYNQVMEGLFDTVVPGEGDAPDVWSKDGWYCLECVRTLFKERLMWYWRAKKEEAGIPILEDCWYGYNCRTQSHKEQHAKRLNHLCVPTRGD
ncbi:uncharacterized protein LAESUDRAFT_812919 [Laetiporus sulphureus 93-53]|uniref:Uncharacterized protein n=1 Tax=Laetiporus sulphureus 93-53 TaxID=1314785 RepID=A0A165E6I5_9APHY|nr:uncharacterized protein LAESUDRAFT_812919 [Laetiporus sulphureus 93-53]KZT06333.1 hypothetical protein LAESUDRAFT_812919 [Laetiporus sulphureus 93-53]